MCNKTHIICAALVAIVGTVQADNYTWSGLKTTQKSNNQREMIPLNDGRGQLMFDPLSVISVDGEVTNVQVVQPAHLRHTGLHARIDSNGSSYEVPFGPEWYMRKIGLELRENQQIQIQGSLIERDGSEILVPTRVTVSGKTFVLRDSNGIPSWKGQVRGFRRGY